MKLVKKVTGAAKRSPISSISDGQSHTNPLEPQHNSGIAEVIGKRDIGAELASQLIDKFGLHEFVVVANVESNDALALKGLRKFPPNPVQVGFLHDEDQIRPANVSLRDDDPGVRLRADGANLISRDALEQLLGGKAPKPIPAADKEQLLD